MLFNSYEFLIFLPLVFVLYWFVFRNSLRAQNAILLFSSYVFYGWWDYRFLGLIFLSSLVDYWVGIQLSKEERPSFRKRLLYLSLAFNLGVLGFFKYYNFFTDSLTDLLNSIGYDVKNPVVLNILLPVGISFYTFQTMSYSIDVYRNHLNAEKDFLKFATFVSFFPQLVAGPIERASQLLPQIGRKRSFNYNKGISGIQLISWGFFKKVVIADSLAPTVNQVFEQYPTLEGGVLWMGLLFFAFQIYCDFSGYSDIAIGTARLFGIDLMVNFNFPYFSRNIGEFWKRWHISLSSWFRDYLYIPIGGSRGTRLNSIRNIFVIFLVSGFWHGASWTFIFWGLVHSLLYIPLFLTGTHRKFVGSTQTAGGFSRALTDLGRVLATFFFVLIAWVFFRSESLADSFNYLRIMFTDLSMKKEFLNPYNNEGVGFLFGLVTLLLALELGLYLGLNRKFAEYRLYPVVTSALNILMVIFLSPLNSNTSFIYFQF